jgi:stearoyl-CoA desaturase (delta-9 desaturase)
VATHPSTAPAVPAVARPRAGIVWSAGSGAFVAVHLSVLAVFYVGWSPVAVAAALVLYAARMFGITAGYHRYFAHASYRTGRAFQFFLGWLGASAAQKGPLWWAGHHRRHHAHADTERDIHSPLYGGMWWSHAGWILSDRFDAVDWAAIRQFARFAELRALDERHWLAPATLGVAVYAAGAALGRWAPGLHTNGIQMLVWGFSVSTVALYHATFSINSLAHLWGRRRFRTNDDSRNNPWLALITLGEGWHNNHHRCPSSERQGFFWWEVDATHAGLWILSRLGLVWDLRSPPSAVYAEAAGCGRQS